MKSLNGIIFGMIAGMLWGIDGALLGHFMANSESVLLITLLTVCIHDGLAALWVFGINAKKRRAAEYIVCVKSKEFPLLFTSAVLGGPIGMTANVLAINMSGAAYSCAVTSTYPVLGSVIGILFLKEKLTGSCFIGIILTALGAAIIGFSSAGKVAGPYFYVGLLVAMLAALSWALEGNLSKYCMKNISPDILLGIRESISFLTFLMLIFLLSKTIPGFSLSIIGDRSSLFLIIASIVGALSFLCWYRSMDISGVAVGMTLNATYALWAAVADIPLNHTKVSIHSFLGIFVILFGTVGTICSQKKRKHK